jgi:single-strand DNA-binding protein
MPNSNAVANISIAVGEQWRDKAGEKQERVTWVNVVAFGKLAEIMAQYTSRGSRIYLSGSLRTRQWEKDGQNHYTTEIVARELQLLDKRDDSRTSDPAQSRAYREASGGSTKSAPAPFDNFEEDDIPW